MALEKQPQAPEYLRPSQENCPSDLSDEQLVQLSLAGVREAFDELVLRYRWLAYGIAVRRVLNDADAWDAVNHSFMKAYAKLKTFKGHSSFKTWVLKIVRNVSLENARAISRRRANEARIAAFRLPHAIRKPLDLLINEERQEAGVRFLQQHATPLMRRVCELRIAEGLSYPEIAQRIGGITARKARALMTQLLKELHEFLMLWE